jgi:glucose/mannose transport system permease protein
MTVVDTDRTRAGGIADRPQGGVKRLLDRFAAQIAVAPGFVVTVLIIYGAVIWTLWVSFSASDFMPNYELVGARAYELMWRDPRWILSLQNLAIFSVLYVGLTLALGLFLAILMDQKIRGEGLFRALFLYPMAISFVVTGVIWQWIFHPSTGIEAFMQSLGWASFSFDWIVNRDMAIYVVVMTAVWQSSGFAMVLFLSGLRAVDQSVVKAARVDGASMPVIYLRIVIPMILPITIAVTVILAQFAIKTFELVLALTEGGPGVSTTMPTLYVFEVFYTRGQIAQGAAAAVTLLCLVALVAMPLLLIRYINRAPKGSEA